MIWWPNIMMMRWSGWPGSSWWSDNKITIWWYNNMVMSLTWILLMVSSIAAVISSWELLLGWLVMNRLWRIVIIIIVIDDRHIDDDDDDYDIISGWKLSPEWLGMNRLWRLNTCWWCYDMYEYVLILSTYMCPQSCVTRPKCKVTDFTLIPNHHPHVP